MHSELLTPSTIDREPTSSTLPETVAIPIARVDDLTTPSLRPQSAAIPKWNALGLIFATTILVSAFLLFQVQPLISKYILPWFGGSPAVWTTCMLFFQLVLFAGYAYAHLLTRFLSPRGQGAVHLSLMILAIVVMFPTIAPAVSWKPIDSSHPTGRILALLAATVGLPYFVLSTTGPLVQAWFAKAWPDRSPYRLYALSNLGSLAALVTFPFVFEPAFGSDTQAGLWTMAFALFAVLCGMCAVWIFRLSESSAECGVRSAESQNAATPHSELPTPNLPPSLSHRLLWLGLPACASLMLLATTNYVCQDVAVIPFLWVVPLSLYLLTFIISFDHPRWYRPVEMSLLALVLLVLSAGAWDTVISLFNLHTNYLHDLVVYFSTMFFACMVCHGQLFRLRPAADRLTEYYLLISAGGALGGIFVSLVAPNIFRTHFEWTLALAASSIVAATVAISQARNWPRPAEWYRLSKPKILTAVGVLSLAAVGWLLYGVRGNADTVYENRNFYGTVSVLESDRNDPNYHRRVFFSGSVAHGKQYVEPDKRRIPISYFGEKTGVGRTLLYFQSRPDTRVGIVGMGVAVAGTYAKPGHYYRFYEINDQVNEIAEHQFTYLEDCEGQHDVILADARLALERELADGHPQNFDVLALDAFNGDAPPVHLLTDEAFEIYLQHLKPDGVIVVNITNRYINLVPVINAVAKKHNLGITRVMTVYEPEKLLNRTDFMLLTRNQDFLAAVPSVLVPENVQPEYEVPLWTDKYSNLFSILKR